MLRGSPGYRRGFYRHSQEEQRYRPNTRELPTDGITLQEHKLTVRQHVAEMMMMIDGDDNDNIRHIRCTPVNLKSSTAELYLEFKFVK